MYTEQELNSLETGFSDNNNISKLVAEVRRLQAETNRLMSEAAGALATKNVAKEILSSTLSTVEKQLKMTANLEDEQGKKFSDSNLTDIKARLESALRVL